MAEFNRVTDCDCSRVYIEDAVAAVVLECGAKKEPIVAAIFP